jgi:hypothetical protein
MNDIPYFYFYHFAKWSNNPTVPNTTVDPKAFSLAFYQSQGI